MFVCRRDECIVSPTWVLEVADAFGQEWAESQFGQMAHVKCESRDLLTASILGLGSTWYPGHGAATLHLAVRSWSAGSPLPSELETMLQTTGSRLDLIGALGHTIWQTTSLRH